MHCLIIMVCLIIPATILADAVNLSDDVNLSDSQKRVYELLRDEVNELESINNDNLETNNHQHPMHSALGKIEIFKPPLRVN